MDQSAASTADGGLQASPADRPEMCLSDFFRNPLWWPQELTCLSSGSQAGCAKDGRLSSPRSPSTKTDAQQLLILKKLLTSGLYESVGFKTEKLNSTDSECAAASMQTAVPACFALFTRFNCNVTLVAQRLFASKLTVSVLFSGSVVANEDDGAVLRTLKNAKPGERVYRRHVMLHVAPETPDAWKLCSFHEPFSYGFLLTFCDALPQAARELVLLEALPFGAVLDHCGVSRAVEVDRQLHIHIGEAFFGMHSSGEPVGSSIHGVRVRGKAQHDQRQSLSLSKGEKEKGCCCRALPDGVRCTFGRQTKIACEGKPAARVVEILNHKLVLSALYEKHQEAQQRRREPSISGQCAISPDDEDNFNSIAVRLKFLSSHCLLSVADCAQHRRWLPRPHLTAQQLLTPRHPSEGCSLCGSQTCSTDFHSEETQDIC